MLLNSTNASLIVSVIKEELGNALGGVLGGHFQDYSKANKLSSKDKTEVARDMKELVKADSYQNFVQLAKTMKQNNTLHPKTVRFINSTGKENWKKIFDKKAA